MERHLLAEKHLLRRKRLARRLQRQPAIRRSATRQEKRHTLLTSTKVPISLHPVDCRQIASAPPPLRFITWSSGLHPTRIPLTRLFIVLKQVHPDTGISNRAMSILNSFVNGKVLNALIIDKPTNFDLQTSSSALPPRHPNSPHTTRSLPSPPARFKHRKSSP